MNNRFKYFLPTFSAFHRISDLSLSTKDMWRSIFSFLCSNISPFLQCCPGGTSKLRMHWHKNKITRLYYHLPYTYTLSEILCTQATEHFNHFSYVLNKFLPLAGWSTTKPTLDLGQPAHLSMLLLILTKDLKRASASYLALWATSMVDCVVLLLYWSLAMLAWYFNLPAVFSDVSLDFI